MKCLQPQPTNDNKQIHASIDPTNTESKYISNSVFTCCSFTKDTLSVLKNAKKTYLYFNKEKDLTNNCYRLNKNLKQR